MHAAEPKIDRDDDKIAFNWRRILINLFIVLHLTVTLCWLTAQNLGSWCRGIQSPVYNGIAALNSKCYPYLMKTGLWQSWSMFAPDPSQLDIYFTAQVHYKSGVVRNYAIPRIASMGYIERYQKERWRKLMENAYSDYTSPSSAKLGTRELFYIARYAALKMPYSASDPPTGVTIAKIWRITRFARTQVPFQKMVFYTTPLSSEDLK